MNEIMVRYTFSPPQIRLLLRVARDARAQDPRCPGVMVGCKKPVGTALAERGLGTMVGTLFAPNVTGFAVAWEVERMFVIERTHFGYEVLMRRSRPGFMERPAKAREDVDARVPAL